MVTKRNMASPLRSQRGVVIVFATLAMAVLIGAGALALDVGNLVLSKGKLQNLADSAALSAAKMISLGGEQNDAIAIGNQTIADNLALDGFNAVSVDSTNVTFEFSEDLPFDSSTATTTSPYVRVRIENVDIPDFLVTIFNIDLSVRASAVAGPSTSLGEVCNLTPLSICEGDFALSDTGYTYKDLYVLKAAKSQDSSIGSGNFMPVVISDTGANAFANALAGGYGDCNQLEEDDPVITEPGNMDGPSLGIDTRFSIYKSIMNNPANKARYKGDYDTGYDSTNQVMVNTVTVTDDESGASYDKYVVNVDDYPNLHTYSKYANFYNSDAMRSCLLNASCDEDKAPHRRIIVVPVLKCDAATMKSGGRMSIPFKSYACFYLVQPMSETKHVDDKGGSDGSWLVGEFIPQCQVGAGSPGINPNENGPYKIVLYKDPDSEDS